MCITSNHLLKSDLGKSVLKLQSTRVTVHTVCLQHVALPGVPSFVGSLGQPRTSQLWVRPPATSQHTRPAWQLPILRFYGHLWCDSSSRSTRGVCRYVNNFVVRRHLGCLERLPKMQPLIFQNGTNLCKSFSFGMAIFGN